MQPFRAQYKVHSLFQSICPMPYAVDFKNFKIVNNNKRRQNITHKFIRTSVLLIISSTIPILIWRLAWLFFNWKYFTVHHIDELIVYSLYLLATSIFFAAYFTELIYNKNIVYLLNQLFKIVQVIPDHISSSFVVDLIIKIPCHGGKTNIMEFLIWQLSTFIFAILPGASLFPFAISYEPLQFICGNSSLIIKLVSSATHFTVFMYLLITILSLLLVSLVICEGLLRYSSTIHFHKSSCNTRPRCPFWICYKRYRMIQLLLAITNDFVPKFYCVLIFVGVFLGSFGTYMTLKMYSMLNIFVYMLAPAVATICFTVAISFNFISHFPCRNSMYFKLCWKEFLVKKEEKRMMWSCKVIGFYLGPYGMATSALGLRICDDIVNNSVNLLLIDA